MIQLEVIFSLFILMSFILLSVSIWRKWILIQILFNAVLYVSILATLVTQLKLQLPIISVSLGLIFLLDSYGMYLLNEFSNKQWIIQIVVGLIFVITGIIYGTIDESYLSISYVSLSITLLHIITFFTIKDPLTQKCVAFANILPILLLISYLGFSDDYHSLFIYANSAYSLEYILAILQVAIASFVSRSLLKLSNDQDRILSSFYLLFSGILFLRTLWLLVENMLSNYASTILNWSLGHVFTLFIYSIILLSISLIIYKIQIHFWIHLSLVIFGLFILGRVLVIEVWEQNSTPYYLANILIVCITGWGLYRLYKAFFYRYPPVSISKNKTHDHQLMLKSNL
jgi:hypothetical protein